MARKGWDNLSPGVRSRYEKAGINRREYSSGASLQKARGHEKTPERPSAAKPEHIEYNEKRERLATKLTDAKQAQWGHAANWNASKARQNSLVQDGKSVGVGKLNEALDYLAQLIAGEIGWDEIPDDIKSIIGYH